jgi:hypothetical protein
MQIFFGILIGLVIFVAILASVLGTVWLFEEWVDSALQGIAAITGCLVVIAGLSAFGISLIPMGNGSEHCGTGTVYRSTSHYSAATKTSVTDWWCEAK